MKTKTALSLLLAATFAASGGASLAEDIDIYSQNTAIQPSAPNVLLIIDNSANWNTRYVDEKAALATIVAGLKTQFNLGLMFYNESGSTHGGYVRFAIQPMTNADGTASEARKCLLRMMGVTGSTAACTSSNANYTDLDRIADKSNAGYIGIAMGEAYSYFAGINAYTGAGVPKGDPLAFVNLTQAGPQYDAPGTGLGCAKNYIIHISNGGQESSATDSDGNGFLTTAGGAAATTVVNPPNDTNPADEWARFLNKSAAGVVTYTLEVDPVTNGQGPTYTKLMQSMARQGKGAYFSAADAATIQTNLARIFNDIQAVNSVFASASLPLSADNTGNFSDQVYMGVFRPDGQGLPRWLGNLKQYKFAVDSNSNLYLADKNGLPAAGTSGFATPDAVSFWTNQTTSAPDAAFATATTAANGSTNGFWFFDSKGSGGNFDLPDGEWVEKGGAAQQLRVAYLGYGGMGGIGDTNTSTLNSKPARLVYTCTGTCLTASGTALSSTPFDSSNTAITSDPTQFGINPVSVTVSSISSDRPVNTISAGTALPAIAANGLVATASLVTVTTSAKHNLPNGTSYVSIAGSSITGTNGTFLVTNTANTKFTYVVSAVTPGTSTGTPTAWTAATLATVTTATNHGLANGAIVNVSGATCSPVGVGAPGPGVTCPFNGTAFTISGVTANAFKITLPGNGIGGSATGTLLASWKVAKVTTTAAHGYTTGDSVTIANATCSPVACTEYNTTATISNITPTTFDYAYSATSPLPVANNSGISSADNTPSGTALTSLLKWVRGQDSQNENGFQVAGANTDVRASIHGDVLHSRPVVLNYATNGAGSDNVYVFYGGNDGVFRAIKGGQVATDGKEQWAFIPKEFFPALKRQYDNSPPVLYPSTPSGLGASKRTYTWDGPVVPYIERDSTGAVTKAYLFLSVRRGGRFIYALDVTSPTNPKILWRKGCTTVGSTTTCDSGYAELGQTWSTPATTSGATPIGTSSTASGLPLVQASEANGHPVLIFGGGYDAASEDPEPPATSDTMGRAVFVVDAFNGSVIWSAGNSANGPTVSVTGMDFSVAADVLAVDRRQVGYTERVYAADVGGNLWRIDTSGTSTSSWAVTKIASLGGRTGSSAGRKFLFGPEVVFGTTGTFDAVVIGSGDREHPLSSNAANSTPNRAYMLIDPNTGVSGSVNQNITESDLFDASNVSTTVDLTNKKGWFVGLRDGEKVINGPVVVASQMVFGTNQPCASGKLDDNGECSSSGNTLVCTGNLGIARRYDINYLTAAPEGFTNSSGTAVRSEVAPGGGFLPTPFSGVVEINGSNYVFLTDNPLNPGGVINPHIDVASKRFRTYWHAVIE